MLIVGFFESKYNLPRTFLHFLPGLSLTTVFLVLSVVLVAFAAGWVYGHERTVKELGWPITLTYMATNFLPVLLACGIWFGVDTIWGGFVALLGGYAVGIGTTLYLLRLKMREDPEKWTWRSILWELTFKNIYGLTQRIKPVVGRIPFIWAFLVKQFIPPVLLILFVNLAQSDNGQGESQFGKRLFPFFF